VATPTDVVGNAPYNYPCGRQDVTQTARGLNGTFVDSYGARTTFTYTNGRVSGSQTVDVTGSVTNNTRFDALGNAQGGTRTVWTDENKKIEYTVENSYYAFGRTYQSVSEATDAGVRMRDTTTYNIDGTSEQYSWSKKDDASNGYERWERTHMGADGSESGYSGQSTSWGKSGKMSYRMVDELTKKDGEVISRQISKQIEMQKDRGGMIKMAIAVAVAVILTVVTAGAMGVTLAVMLTMFTNLASFALVMGAAVVGGILSSVSSQLIMTGTVSLKEVAKSVAISVVSAVVAGAVLNSLNAAAPSLFSSGATAAGSSSGSVTGALATGFNNTVNFIKPLFLSMGMSVNIATACAQGLILGVVAAVGAVLTAETGKKGYAAALGLIASVAAAGSSANNAAAAGDLQSSSTTILAKETMSTAFSLVADEVVEDNDNPYFRAALDGVSQGISRIGPKEEGKTAEKSVFKRGLESFNDVLPQAFLRAADVIMEGEGASQTLRSGIASGVGRGVTSLREEERYHSEEREVRYSEDGESKGLLEKVEVAAETMSFEAWKKESKEAATMSLGGTKEDRAVSDDKTSAKESSFSFVDDAQLSDKRMAMQNGSLVMEAKVEVKNLPKDQQRALKDGGVKPNEKVTLVKDFANRQTYIKFDLKLERMKSFMGKEFMQALNGLIDTKKLKDAVVGKVEGRVYVDDKGKVIDRAVVMKLKTDALVDPAAKAYAKAAGAETVTVHLTKSGRNCYLDATLAAGKSMTGFIEALSASGVAQAQQIKDAVKAVFIDAGKTKGGSYRQGIEKINGVFKAKQITSLTTRSDAGNVKDAKMAGVLSALGVTGEIGVTMLFKKDGSFDRAAVSSLSVKASALTDDNLSAVEQNDRDMGLLLKSVKDSIIAGGIKDANAVELNLQSTVNIHGELVSTMTAATLPGNIAANSLLAAAMKDAALTDAQGRVVFAMTSVALGSVYQIDPKVTKDESVVRVSSKTDQAKQSASAPAPRGEPRVVPAAALGKQLPPLANKTVLPPQGGLLLKPDLGVMRPAPRALFYHSNKAMKPAFESMGAKGLGKGLTMAEPPALQRQKKQGPVHGARAKESPVRAALRTLKEFAGVPMLFLLGANPYTPSRRVQQFYAEQNNAVAVGAADAFADGAYRDEPRYVGPMKGLEKLSVAADKVDVFVRGSVDRAQRAERQTGLMIAGAVRVFGAKNTADVISVVHDQKLRAERFVWVTAGESLSDALRFGSEFGYIGEDIRQSLSAIKSGDLRAAYREAGSAAMRMTREGGRAWAWLEVGGKVVVAGAGRVVAAFSKETVSRPVAGGLTKDVKKAMGAYDQKMVGRDEAQARIFGSGGMEEAFRAAKDFRGKHAGYSTGSGRQARRVSEGNSRMFDSGYRRQGSSAGAVDETLFGKMQAGANRQKSRGKDSLAAGKDSLAAGKDSLAAGKDSFAGGRDFGQLFTRSSFVHKTFSESAKGVGEGLVSKGWRAYREGTSIDARGAGALGGAGSQIESGNNAAYVRLGGVAQGLSSYRERSWEDRLQGGCDVLNARSYAAKEKVFSDN
jgi:hypothetical protein